MIWLIGNKGMLGKELAGLFKAKQMPYAGTDRETDITDIETLRSFSRGKDLSWIVNCSAYTAVDKAEEESDTAYLINEKGVGNIGTLSEEIGVKVIHLSTDYVFDGKKNYPLAEDEPTGPTSVYGRSKLAGEIALQERNRRSFIIRTAWLYGREGANFVYTMLRLMRERESIKVVDDQIGSPTWTYDLASLIVRIIESDSEDYGIYHFSGAGQTSWYGFAREIYRQGKERGIISGDCAINPCTTDEFPASAARPAYSLLSKEKVKTVLKGNVPSWEESLNHFFERGLAE